MISIKPITKDYAEYMLATEYYLGKDGAQQETLRWGGKGLGDLGLEGKAVTVDDVNALFKGFSPSGEALCQNAGAEGELEVKINKRTGKPRLDKNGEPVTVIRGGHRAGLDMTFNAPKPVSLAFVIGSPEEREAIMKAHHKAMAPALKYLEGACETRRGKAGKNVIGVDGVVWLQADHVSSRELDMQIHSHTVFMGVARGEDGKWSTFDTHELFRHRRAADQLYTNQLAVEMRAMGYGIETEHEVNADQKLTGNTTWSIAGISEELCDTFSKRRAAIVEYQADHKVDAQTACMATRKHKDEPSFPELIDTWQKTMAEMEMASPGMINTTAELKTMESKFAQPVSEAVMLERLHDKNAVVCEHNLVERIGMEYAGQIGADEIFAKVEEFKKTAGLVLIEPEKIHKDDRGQTLARVHTEDRYAAPWMLAWEQEIMHRSEARIAETNLHLSPETIEKTVLAYEERKGFTISGEQREAFEHLAAKTGGVGVLSGVAGSGKTTLSDLYSEAYKAEGYTLLGVAVGNAAAKKLEHESGMECCSVSKMLSMLDKKTMKLTDKHVVVLDESGMVDTDQTRRLMSWCDKSGAKLILQGDANQLQPVGAGSGMGLTKEAIGDARLTEIRRQENAEDRDLARLFYDQDAAGNLVENPEVKSRRDVRAKGEKIFAALDRRGCLDDYDTRHEAITAIVQDYIASPTSPQEKLILGHSRADVSALNEGVREALRKDGKLGENAAHIKAKDGGRWAEMNLACGDLICFTARDNVVGVINGTRGQLVSVEEGRRGGYDLKVRVQSDIESENGRVIAFNSQHYNALTHDYAMTVHKAQGQGRQEVQHLANAGMIDNQSSLVAFTRLTSGTYTMYGTSDDFERIASRLGMDRLKGTALQAGVKQVPEQAVNKAPVLRNGDTQWIEENTKLMATRTMSAYRGLGEQAQERPEPRQEQVPKREQWRGRGRGR